MKTTDTNPEAATGYAGGNDKRIFIDGVIEITPWTARIEQLERDAMAMVRRLNDANQARSSLVADLESLLAENRRLREALAEIALPWAAELDARGEEHPPALRKASAALAQDGRGE